MREVKALEDFSRAVSAFNSHGLYPQKVRYGKANLASKDEPFELHARRTLATDASLCPAAGSRPSARDVSEGALGASVLQKATCWLPRVRARGGRVSVSGLQGSNQEEHTLGP